MGHILATLGASRCIWGQLKNIRSRSSFGLKVPLKNNPKKPFPPYCTFQLIGHDLGSERYSLPAPSFKSFARILQKVSLRIPQFWADRDRPKPNGNFPQWEHQNTIILIIRAPGQASLSLGISQCVIKQWNRSIPYPQ